MGLNARGRRWWLAVFLECPELLITAPPERTYIYILGSEATPKGGRDRSEREFNVRRPDGSNQNSHGHTRTKPSATRSRNQTVTGHQLTVTT